MNEQIGKYANVQKALQLLIVIIYYPAKDQDAFLLFV